MIRFLFAQISCGSTVACLRGGRNDLALPLHARRRFNRLTFGHPPLEGRVDARARAAGWGESLSCENGVRGRDCHPTPSRIWRCSPTLPLQGGVITLTAHERRFTLPAPTTWAFEGNDDM